MIKALHMHEKNTETQDMCKIHIKHCTYMKSTMKHDTCIKNT